MSYMAKCLVCGCTIFMEDDFDEADDRRCEECRSHDDEPPDVELRPSYTQVRQFLESCSMTMVPALLGTLITRCAREPIFKGWMGMHSFIQNAYKKAGAK